MLITATLLAAIGYDSMEAFITDVVPAGVYYPDNLHIGDPLNLLGSYSTPLATRQFTKDNTVFLNRNEKDEN